MVTATLVEARIESGKELLRKLDDGKFPLSAAFWLFTEEAPQWCLVLASRIVDELGPSEAYKRVQEIILKQGIDIELRDVSVVSPKSQVVSLLRTAIVTGPGIHGIRFTGNAINGVFIADAYIYRTL